MLKPYNDLRKIDVSEFCETKKGKDDSGKVIEIKYLNWAKCVDLLHQNGAEVVYFTPLRSESGSFLLENKVVQNKDGRSTGCYFVAVEIHIDDKTYTIEQPLMNGNLVVYDDTLNQLRIANAHARAFVKGVAIHTGLGFDLWVKGGEEETTDDLSIHSIYAIKKRVEELLTIKIQNGRSKNDILSSLQINEKQFQSIMGYYDQLYKFEKALSKA